MPISDWPKEDRPREKLLYHGASALTDAELIAIFLQSGLRGKSALDIAKELLKEFGGLKKLLQTPAATLIKKRGVGQAKYAAIQAAAELGRRSLSENISPGTILNSSRLSQKFLSDKLRHYQNEVFACLFLDNHFRLLGYEELFRGTINEANIYPRELVRRGLAHNAAKIILAHNHPSGQAAPSPADKDVTQVIRQAMSLIDIEVVDHIIVGHVENFSFAEARLL